MGPRRSRVIDARQTAVRKAERHKIGKLRNLVVSKETLVRYKTQTQRYFAWLDEEERELAENLPDLDESLVDYLEYLWGTGEPRSAAANCLCGLQHLLPRIKRNIPEAWRIYGAWQSREEPARAWPFNRQEACALAQTALDLVDFRMAFMVWIAFVVYLRPCEIVYRCFGDFAWADGGQALVIHLGYTKGGKRRNTQEQVVCRDPYALLLFALISEDRQPHELVYPEGMARSRRQFSTLLSSLGLDAYPFKPYSLRRGGATHAFMECKSYSAVMETGRWMGLRTAKIYINEAAALLAKRGLRESVRATIDRQAAKLVALMS